MTAQESGEHRLRTVDIARESGYSVQQVRDLERLGVLPPAARSANGYRAYTPTHLRTLRAYRGLASAAGPVAARHLLAGLWTATVADAASAVSEIHVRLARERDEALRALEALSTIEREMDVADREISADLGNDSLTITELAAALGVRPSTLRYWEQQGLVSPERVTSLRARRYDPAATGAARIVAALRAGGYGIPVVRGVMATLHRPDGVVGARRFLDERLDGIAARMVALLRAGADLAAVVESRGPRQ